MAPAVLYLTYRLFVVGDRYFSGTWRLKTILPAILISFYMYPVSACIMFYVTGGIDVMDYPKSLIYWFWFGLVFVFQLATWILITDIVKLLTRIFPKKRNWGNRIHAKAALLLFITIFCYTGWKVYRDTTHIKTEEITLSIEGLPESLQDFEIIHITDIQGDRYTGREEIARYIRKINEQNPDLIIFTGDLISYGTDYIKQSAEELGKADSRFGTIAVVGDHDYWAGLAHIQKALEKEGSPLLQDENYIIKIDSTTNILTTGVTEVYSKASNPQIVDSLTSSTKVASLKIFASHQIDNHIIRSANKNGYNILLAGHTHGGQIQVPFMGMSFSASERETKYISGLYREGNLPINVNNGLGFTLAPIRYDAPPNVSVITLERK
jgi:predicted MPP superfamily phosphohydrolase